MNELCLCEVAEIHLVVSSMDFCAGRSLMSLHVFKILFVCAFMCVRLPNYICVKAFSYLLCLCVYICVCVYRCMACVGSMWGCQWNTLDHTCSDKDNVNRSNIIKHRQVSLLKCSHISGMSRTFMSDSKCLISAGKSEAEVSKDTSNHHK